MKWWNFEELFKSYKLYKLLAKTKKIKIKKNIPVFPLKSENFVYFRKFFFYIFMAQKRMFSDWRKNQTPNSFANYPRCY